MGPCSNKVYFAAPDDIRLCSGSGPILGGGIMEMLVVGKIMSSKVVIQTDS